MTTHVDDCTSLCTSFVGERHFEASRLKHDIFNFFEFKEKDLKRHANLLEMTVYYNDQDDYVKLFISLKIKRAVEKYNLQDVVPAKTLMTTNALVVFDKDTSEAFNEPSFSYSTLIGELL